jgi:hypothetical protein
LNKRDANVVIDWLLSPLSGLPTHDIAPMIAWHARAMVLAWGVIIPVAILLARYWKIWPGQRWPQELDHKLWWHAHKYGQTLAVVLMTLGVYLAWRARSAQWSPGLMIHASLGWFLVLLGWMQLLGGWLRGSKGGPGEASLTGDHFNMTARRRAFEWTHKVLGWLALSLALLTIVLGLWLADAPRWMLLSLTLWWAGLVALAWRWQSQAKCIDTYQAIWGPDPNLPGMKFPPIGWGIRRVNSPH